MFIDRKTGIFPMEGKRDDTRSLRQKDRKM